MPARCDAIGDLDADRLHDRVLLVSRAGERGIAVIWGSGTMPTLLGAGAKFRVVEFGDTTADTPRAEGTDKQHDTDLSYVVAWDLLTAIDDGDGAKSLRPASGRAFDFLPAVHGDAIRISDGDAAWVVYRTADRAWYSAPLGY